MIDAALFIAKRQQLSIAVMNDSNRRAEAKLQRALANGERILRIVHSSADYGIDVHVKVGIVGQHLQLFVEDLQALLRNFVRIDVINRNL